MRVEQNNRRISHHPLPCLALGPYTNTDPWKRSEGNFQNVISGHPPVSMLPPVNLVYLLFHSYRIFFLHMTYSLYRLFKEPVGWHVIVQATYYSGSHLSHIDPSSLGSLEDI